MSTVIDFEDLAADGNGSSGGNSYGFSDVPTYAEDTFTVSSLGESVGYFAWWTSGAWYNETIAPQPQGSAKTAVLEHEDGRHFDFQSLKLADSLPNGGGEVDVTLTGYRNGTETTSVTFTLTDETLQEFAFGGKNWRNLDKVEISGNDFFQMDDLTVKLRSETVSKKTVDEDGLFTGTTAGDNLKIKRGDFTIDLVDDDNCDHISFDNRGAGTKTVQNFDLGEDSLFFRLDGGYFEGFDALGGNKNQATIDSVEDFSLLLDAIESDNGSENEVAVDDDDLRLTIDADNHFRGDLTIIFEGIVSDPDYALIA